MVQQFIYNLILYIIIMSLDKHSLDHDKLDNPRKLDANVLDSWGSEWTIYLNELMRHWLMTELSKEDETLTLMTELCTKQEDRMAKQDLIIESLSKMDEVGHIDPEDKEKRQASGYSQGTGEDIPAIDTKKDKDEKEYKMDDEKDSPEEKVMKRRTIDGSYRSKINKSYNPRSSILKAMTGEGLDGVQSPQTIKSMLCAQITKEYIRTGGQMDQVLKNIPTTSN